MKLWLRQAIFWWGLSLGLLAVAALGLIGAWAVMAAVWRLW